ncbi:MAG: Gmad2 immunoglobulin-like domain-containing protein [Candidatus Desulforudaceae bacterium]|jgi:hypothetical protein
MQKIRLLVLVLFAIGILVAGCSANNGIGENPVPGEPPGMGEGEHQIYPESVMETLETLKAIHAGFAIVENGKTFVIVSYGEKPTAGYEVRIVDIKTEGERAVVTAELIEPDGPAAMVLTYPYAVEVLDGAYSEVEFHEAGGEYFPQIVGWVGPISTQERSNNIVVSAFAAAPDMVYATGIARVFEATVSYEVQDAAGNVLTEGYTTAASGGPDWGFFEVRVTHPPVGAAKLVVFQASAKDGSMTDAVELPIILSRA